jgi:hypothetical protein
VEDKLHRFMPCFLIILNTSQRPDRCHKVVSISILADGIIELQHRILGWLR